MAVLEITNHIPTESTESPEQEVGTSNLKAVLRFDRIL